VTPEASDSASFDEGGVLELCNSRPVAAARSVDDPEEWEPPRRDRPARKPFTESIPACGDVGGPAMSHVHRRHGRRRRTRSQRAAPGRLLGHRRRRVVLASGSECSKSTPTRRAQGPAAAAGCSSSTPPPAASSTTRAHGRSWPRTTLKQDWLHEAHAHFESCPRSSTSAYSRASVLADQQTFGYTEEELRVLIHAWRAPARSLSARWAPTAVADALRPPRMLFDYFTELFAR